MKVLVGFLLTLMTHFAMGQATIQSGIMTIEQKGPQAVELRVDIYFDINALFRDTIQVLWGDGLASPIGIWEQTELVDKGLRLLRFAGNHTYPSRGMFAVMVNVCCWSSSILNIQSLESNSFQLRNEFDLLSLQFNEPMISSKILSDINIFSGVVGVPFQSPIAHEAGFGDSVTFVLIESAAIGYTFPGALSGGSQNEFSISQDGDIYWDMPEFPGTYSFGVQVNEYLRGEQVQQNTYHSTIHIDLTTSSQVAEFEEISIMQNPGNGMIELTDPVQEILIRNIQGQIIGRNKSTHSISIEGEAVGIYFVEAIEPMRRIVKRYFKSN